jgi:hypothetical protein
MKRTLEAQGVTPPLPPQRIRTRILISRLDPPRVVELVEYTDGQFGIQEDGVAVAHPWERRRLGACVRSYYALAEKVGSAGRTGAR